MIGKEGQSAMRPVCLFVFIRIHWNSIHKVIEKHLLLLKWKFYLMSFLEIHHMFLCILM